MTKGNLRLDAATGLVHTVPPGADFTDCGLMLRKLQTQNQARGKVKESKRCPDCEVKRATATRPLLGVV